MPPSMSVPSGPNLGLVPSTKSSTSRVNVIGLAVGMCFAVVFLGLASRAMVMRRQRRASSASYYANSGLPKFTQRSGSDIGSPGPNLSPTFSDIDQGPESFSAGVYAYKYSDGDSPTGSVSPTLSSRNHSMLGSPDRRASSRRTTRTSIDIEDDCGLELIDSIQTGPEYVESVCVDRVPSFDAHVQSTRTMMTANPIFAAQGTHTEEHAETGAKSALHVARDGV